MATQVDAIDVAGVAAIGCGLAVCIGCIARFGRSIGNVSCRYSSGDLSPGAAAFGIWGLIFAAAAVDIALQVAALATPVAVRNTPRSNFLLAASWACAGLWVAVFTGGQRTRVVVAAAVLLAAAGTSIAAVFLGVSQESNSYLNELRSSPASLLAGWLTVAALLSVVIAVRAGWAEPEECPNEYPRDYSLRDPTNEEYASPVPLALAVAVCAAAVAAARPVYALPPAWAVFNLRSTLSNRVAFAVLVGGFGVAVWRLSL